MAALIGLAIGASVAIVGGIASGVAASSQAKKQKAATEQYARALRRESRAVPTGGISQAQQRTQMTTGALQGASQAQHMLDQSKRGSGTIDPEALAATANAQQAASAQQQSALDAMSTQVAQQNAARKQQLRLQALQADLQAQSIDPTAQLIQGYASGHSAAGQGTMSASAPAASQQMSSMGQGAAVGSTQPQYNTWQAPPSTAQSYGQVYSSPYTLYTQQ